VAPIGCRLRPFETTESAVVARIPTAKGSPVGVVSDGTARYRRDRRFGDQSGAFGRCDPAGGALFRHRVADPGY
jgi:hypothetical protein